MSGGPGSPYRSSLNVQTARPDALRNLWLGEAAQAPDAYRDSWGLASLTPQTRSAVMSVYGPEQPFIDGPDYFGHGRPVQIPEFDPGISHLSALGQPSQLPRPFTGQVADALLGQDVGNALNGRPTGGEPMADALAALFGGPRQTLGGTR